MTHELKDIVREYQAYKSKGKSVLASVCALDGSSYRRPGVRMLLLDNGSMIGAVSGGCVEKEIQRQAEMVFTTGTPRMMIYDGRYRLGCEGVLYILIEPFSPDQILLDTFWQHIEQRKPLKLVSQYTREQKEDQQLGSFFSFDGEEVPLRKELERSAALEGFEQELAPCFRLLIIGGEHDAVSLCRQASNLGWEVHVVTHPTDEKSIQSFKGAAQFSKLSAEEFETIEIDRETAVMLMTHSYAKDLQFLIALKDQPMAYLGILGPSARREELLHEFMEHCPDVEESFLDGIHGPAGLNIGAETAQEIGISILSEILSVIRGQEVVPLKDKEGRIHTS
ncbi:MAG: XdhC family protein [Bacteroidia bacterium]|nr:XdhC family protein [Bacteroidia bacterium]